ncbi:MAG: PfkB family carbohydrate kinase [Promethearchaeota archaeon]
MPEEDRFDIVFMGHFAIDTIIYNNVESHSLGGGVTYGSLAAYYYKPEQKIGIFSEVGKDFNEELLDIFKNTRIDLDGINVGSEYTTNYRLEYIGNYRKLTLNHRANNLKLENLPDKYKNAKCFILAPIANEIDYDFIKGLVEQTDAFIALDVQGFIRKFKEDGTIDTTPDPKRQKLMRDIIDLCNGRLILKASDYEANYITGLDDIIQTTKELAKDDIINITKNLADNHSAIMLSTLGPEGSLLKSKNVKMIHVSAILPEKEIVDETGAGDCYTAVFVSEYLNSKHSWDEFKRAGYCASAACSFLLEHKGPVGFASREQVIKRLENKRVIPTDLHEKVKKNFF